MTNFAKACWNSFSGAITLRVQSKATSITWGLCPEPLAIARRRHVEARAKWPNSK
jgi:hypothetical protein